MYEGYLELGGGEVLNSARALGYAKTADCPVSWIQCPPCGGIRDMLGDDPYTYATIASAPWYDADDDVTARFLGAHAITVEGIPDDTREAGVVETMLDGGVVGRVRKATRRMRYRALLTAKGEDALEIGFSWLSAALTPGSCGTHGDGCGAADMEVFTACPPERTDITTPMPVWNSPLTNLATNPSFEVDAATWVASGSTIARSTARFHSGVASLLVTCNATNGPGAYANLATESGQTYTLSAWVFAPVAVTLSAGFSNASGQVNNGNVAVPANTWTRLWVTGLSTSTIGGFWIATVGTPAAGTQFYVDDVLVEKSSSVGVYFDGSYPDSTPDDLKVVGKQVSRYGWTGTPNASTSTYESGSVVAVPDPVEYERVTERLVRNLHTVTCVSGPIVEQKLHRGDTWGYIVEFVLVAAVPWMFSVTKPVTLQPSLPVVVQDVPFNLVPYPSAELAAGTVVAATNFVTNPSAEAAITGWTAAVDAAKILAPQVAIAQSNELASAGTQSAKVLFTANTTNTAGWFAAQQEIALPGITATTRYSVNLWAVASVQSGTAVIGSIEYEAVWMNASSTVLRTDTIGTNPGSGGAKSMKSILPPTGTTKVVIRARAVMTSWSTGAIVRLYADAAAVTVP